MLGIVALVDCETQLQCERLAVLVPIAEELALALVDLHVRDLERHGLVRLAGEQQILHVLVGSLHFLLKGRHEAMSRLQLRLVLWVRDLEQQDACACVRVALFGYLVARQTDLECARAGGCCHRSLLSRQHIGSRRRMRLVVGLFGRTPSEIGLVTLALGMRQIIAFIVVQREAKLTLVRAQVILHKVRVLGQIHRFERQLPKPLASVHIGLRLGGHASSTRLGSHSVLEVHRPQPKRYEKLPAA